MKKLRRTATRAPQAGWITRTEDIQLPTELAVSATKANLQRAYCQARDYQPTP